MEKKLFTTPTNAIIGKKDYYQYLLLINPDAIVTQQVHRIKNDFYERYGELRAIKSKPHITIGTFVMKDYAEDILIKWIQKLCQRIPSFTIEINGFNGFEPHTLYLQVSKNDELRQLIKQLKELESSIIHSTGATVQFTYQSHLTICRGLSPEIYQTAMSYYKHKSFSACFNSAEMLLLKRTNETEAYKIANVFRFAGIPQPKQLALDIF